LANVDNTGADVVQFRQTWIRNTTPRGNTTDVVYGVLRARSMLRLPECAMSSGNGGYIEIARWDRSNPDVTQQTLTTGYATYSESPPGQYNARNVVSDGLCFADWQYRYDGPVTPFPVEEIDRSRWPKQALPQPWSARPVVSRRVAQDFVLPVVDLGFGTPSAMFFVDEAKGYMHSFIPLTYLTLLDNASSGIAVPLHWVETKRQFNDLSFNCLGRFRADRMFPENLCDTGLDQTNPQWGCVDDASCPPAGGFGTPTSGAAGPIYTTAYVLIVDLEAVWSQTLQSTLCVSYPGTAQSETDGWSNPTSWGRNCRGSPKWNPSLPDDVGLPMGDWCSRSNSPATATCHDAYRVETYSTAQAFKVRAESCALPPP